MKTYFASIMFVTCFFGCGGDDRSVCERTCDSRWKEGTHEHDRCIELACSVNGPDNQNKDGSGGDTV